MPMSWSCSRAPRWVWYWPPGLSTSEYRRPFGSVSCTRSPGRNGPRAVLTASNLLVEDLPRPTVADTGRRTIVAERVPAPNGRSAHPPGGQCRPQVLPVQHARRPAVAVDHEELPGGRGAHPLG